MICLLWRLERGYTSMILRIKWPMQSFMLSIKDISILTVPIFRVSLLVLGNSTVFVVSEINPFQSYLNETEIGGAFARTIGKTVKREDLFITAKLWNHSHQPDQVEAACDQSMRELGLDYLDLYLMHFPT